MSADRSLSVRDRTRYATTNDVARATGLSFRQVDYWCTNGVITPTRPSSGSGRPRGFSPAEVDCLRLLALVQRLYASFAEHDSGIRHESLRRLAVQILASPVLLGRPFFLTVEGAVVDRPVQGALYVDPRLRFDDTAVAS